MYIQRHTWIHILHIHTLHIPEHIIHSFLHTHTHTHPHTHMHSHLYICRWNNPQSSLEGDFTGTETDLPKKRFATDMLWSC